MQKIIEKVAVCEIFWASNFKDYASASTECYSEIQNITNYSLFSCKVMVTEWDKTWYVRLLGLLASKALTGHHVLI